MVGHSMASYTSESETKIQSYIDSLLLDSNSVSDSSENQQPESSLSSAVGASLDAGSPHLGAEAAAAQANPLASTSPETVTARSESGHADSVDASQSLFVRQLGAVQRAGSQEQGNDKSTAFTRRIDHLPSWAGEQFDCLLFNVSGLKLALPMSYIDGMQPLDLHDAPANDEEDSPIFMGTMLIPSEEGAFDSALVVDTARLVMPERYGESMRDAYRYVLMIKDTSWCIAVDSVGGELTFSSQAVRWRSEHTRREWLAGTVVDKMCAIIDIEALSRHLLAEQVLGSD